MQQTKQTLEERPHSLSRSCWAKISFLVLWLIFNPTVTLWFRGSVCGCGRVQEALGWDGSVIQTTVRSKLKPAPCLFFFMPKPNFRWRLFILIIYY